MSTPLYIKPNKLQGSNPVIGVSRILCETPLTLMEYKQGRRWLVGTNSTEVSPIKAKMFTSVYILNAGNKGWANSSLVG